MSAREPKLLVVREGLGPLLANNDRARRASQVNLILPCEQSREPQRAEGAPRNTPPKSSWLSPTMGTREIPGRMVRMVEVGRREPYENPIPSWEVGRGIVVGARESRVHQDAAIRSLEMTAPVRDEGSGPPRSLITWEL